MRLVLRLLENELDGADDPDLVLRDEQRPPAGDHILGDALPELLRTVWGERVQEAHTGVAVDRVDQDVRESPELRVVDRVESSDDDVGTSLHERPFSHPTETTSCPPGLPRPGGPLRGQTATYASNPASGRGTRVRASASTRSGA